MPKVSLFKSITETKNPENVDVIQLLEQTRDGYWEDIVTECRLIKDKAERDAFKDKMPRVTFSGTFSYRSDKSLDKHSGFLAVDIDEVENIEVMRGVLERDRYVFSCFVSASGHGMRAIFKIDPEKHKQAFRGLKKYLHEEYDIICDYNSHLSKPYVVSYDPFLFMRMEITDVPVFKKYPPEEPVKKIADLVHTHDDFERIVKEIVDKRICMLDDYYDYMKVGLAIAKEYGESGRENFHRLSSTSSKYNPKKTDQEYKYFLRQTGSGEANIATFYYYAKMHGIKITSERTKTIVRATKIGRKAGLKKEQIAENLKKYDNIENAMSVVEQIYDTAEDNDKSEESILFQLEVFILNNYSLRMNEVTGYLEQKGVQLSQGDLNSIFVASKKQIPTLDYQLMMRLLKSSDFIPRYNPFFEFFGSDGIAVVLPALPEEIEIEYESPLIDKLAQSIENENPAYTRFFVRKWIVSIISAAHKVHSPLLLCLLGGQNTGKTEWFRRLLPMELQGYYAESKLDKEKDDELLMTENLLIMDDELGGKSKTDNLKLKNITSKQHFSLRRPYADHNEKILRYAVLCGTSNTLNIMSDTTGNRRIIPIEVTNINKELYNSIDKRELFLEAFRLYKEGFDWRITSKDLSFLNQDQERYEMVVAERELIERYFAPSDDRKLSTTDIKVEIELMTHQKLNVAVIGRELERAGFKRVSSREGDRTPKKWLVKRINRGSDQLRPDDDSLKKEDW